MIKPIITGFKKLPESVSATFILTIGGAIFTASYTAIQDYSIHQRTAYARHIFRSTLSSTKTPLDIEHVFSAHKKVAGDPLVNAAQMLCENGDLNEILTIVGTKENVYSVCRIVDREINVN